MLEQRARVVHSSGDNVWVEAMAPEDCGVCEGQGCASRRLGELFQLRPRQYAVTSQLPVAPGDSVIVGIPDGIVLKTAFYLYGMPLGLIMTGALLFQAWFPGDLGAVMGSLMGMSAAGLLIASSGRKHRADTQPVLLRRLVSASIVEVSK